MKDDLIFHAENNKALDIYADGWAKGDSSIIYEVLNDSYKFSGLPNMDPVEKEKFKAFWVDFRSNIGKDIFSSTFAIVKIWLNWCFSHPSKIGL